VILLQEPTMPEVEAGAAVKALQTAAADHLDRSDLADAAMRLLAAEEDRPAVSQLFAEAVDPLQRENLCKHCLFSMILPTAQTLLLLLELLPLPLLQLLLLVNGDRPAEHCTEEIVVADADEFPKEQFQLGEFRLHLFFKVEDLSLELELPSRTPSQPPLNVLLD